MAHISYRGREVRGKGHPDFWWQLIREDESEIENFQNLIGKY